MNQTNSEWVHEQVKTLLQTKIQDSITRVSVDGRSNEQEIIGQFEVDGVLKAYRITSDEGGGFKVETGEVLV